MDSCDRETTRNLADGVARIFLAILGDNQYPCAPGSLRYESGLKMLRVSASTGQLGPKTLQKALSLGLLDKECLPKDKKITDIPSFLKREAA